MNIEFYKKICNKIELPLIILWECLLIIRTVSLYSLLPSKLDTILFSIISVLGIVILIKNSIEWIDKKRKYDIFLMVFIISALISSVYFGSGIIIGNIKIIFWQVLLVFVIYENGKFDKYFLVVEKILMYAWFTLILISLILFFAKVSITIPLSKLYYGIRFGFVENRLFGVFVDPNYSSTISVVVILISMSFIRKTSSYIQRIFLVVNIILQVFYIALSGSRTALVEIAICLFVGVFFLTIQKNKKLVTIFQGLVLSVISILTVVFIINVTQNASLRIVNAYSTPMAVQKYVTDVNSRRPNKSDKIVVENEKHINLDRKDVKNNSDISNNRFNLWKSAIEIFIETPIFGTSPRGLIPFAQKHLPNTLIGKNGQSPHNFFFYSLAAVGLLGTIPLLLFLIYNIIRTIINLWNLKVSYNYDYMVIILITLTLLVSGSLLPDLIFFNKLGSFLFWIYLGKVVGQNKKIEFDKRSGSEIRGI
jgi:hypothetical protein